MKKKKREITPKQLENLKKGREKLFQKQLKEKGIIPNSKPKIVRQNIVNHTTTYNSIYEYALNMHNRVLLTNEFE